MNGLGNGEYPGFLSDLKSRIRKAQYEALRAANKKLIALYWDLGKAIHDRQEELGWGKSVVERLAKDLQTEFPGVQGFSIQNLWLMRQLYAEYHANPISPTIGWRNRME